jgi:hypothetical protein
MLITDQLNLMGMSGLNPFMGPNLDEIGPTLSRYESAL